jgi:hypothetical protein
VIYVKAAKIIKIPILPAIIPLKKIGIKIF